MKELNNIGYKISDIQQLIDEIKENSSNKNVLEKANKIDGKTFEIEEILEKLGATDYT